MKRITILTIAVAVSSAAADPQTRPPPLPKLAPVEVEAAPVTDLPPSLARRRSGMGLMVVGLATVTGGAVFGLQANSKWNDAQGNCIGKQCTREALELIDSARFRADLSTGLFLAGTLIGTAGIYLFVTSPRPRPKTPPRAALHVVPSPRGFGLVGSF